MRTQIIVGLMVAAFVGACGNKATAPSSQTSGVGGQGGQLPDAGPADAGEQGGGGATAGGGGGDASADAPPAVTPTGLFVVDHWYLGDTDASDVPDKTAWKHLGLNLDGLSSNPASATHCLAYQDTDPAKIKEDGDDGADNSFGRNLVPLIQSAGIDLSKSINSSVATGWSTLLIRTNLLDLPPGAGAASVQIYDTAVTASPPLFDGGDAFPIDSSALVAGGMEPGDAIATDPQAVLKGDTLTITLPADAALRLNFKSGPYQFGFTAHRVKLVLTMDPTRAHLSAGVVAGVFYTEEVITELDTALGNVDPALCTSGLLPSLGEIVRSAQDILADETNQSGVSCDAISFGLGFRGIAAKLGEIVPVQQPSNPCGG
jgi:hypothetical protein